MNKVSLIKVNDYCKHMRRCCTLLKTEKQYTKEGMKPSAFSWMQVAKYLTPLGKRLQHPSCTYEKALAQLLSKCIGRHWQTSGCERGPGGRESVEAARQIHCCGQKVVSSNERVVCFLYSGFSLFSGINFRPENTIQIQSRARFFRPLREKHTSVCCFSHPAAAPQHTTHLSFLGGP